MSLISFSSLLMSRAFRLLFVPLFSWLCSSFFFDNVFINASTLVVGTAAKAMSLLQMGWFGTTLHSDYSNWRLFDHLRTRALRDAFRLLTAGVLVGRLLDAH